MDVVRGKETERAAECRISSRLLGSLRKFQGFIAERKCLKGTISCKWEKLGNPRNLLARQRKRFHGGENQNLGTKLGWNSGSREKPPEFHVVMLSF
ncbi:hypothetical protein TgHK011_007028 [Trichoderma gracile]|nr:hypothetical protein TgHK011_007028 [Trichoderma gracile]